MPDNPNYLELALNTFNKEFHQWYGYEDITLGDGTCTENGYSIYSNVISHYEDASIPTEEEVNAKIAELTIPDWKINRLKEYPSVEDCIHALLDGGDTLTDLQAARQVVKDNNPKPS